VTIERDDGLEVVVTSLALEPAAVRACTSLLSGAERERAGRFAFPRDARRYIVGRARLRELLGARSGVRPESVALVTGAQGKPALADPGRGRDLRFNLAHSDEVAVYAFTSGREVGIDVEAVRTLRDTDALAAHWFSHSENEAYQALDPRQKLLGFFHCWTRKEAFVKALGEGLSRPLDSFDVSLAPGAAAELLRVEARPGDDRRWHMESFFPAPGFVAAVVAEVR
jgi:4'-phosphopantetheinyl transferase